MKRCRIRQFLGKNICAYVHTMPTNQKIRPYFVRMRKAAYEMRNQRVNYTLSDRKIPIKKPSTCRKKAHNGVLHRVTSKDGCIACSRHCEELSDEAIQKIYNYWIASLTLAMTKGNVLTMTKGNVLAMTKGNALAMTNKINAAQ